MTNPNEVKPLSVEFVIKKLKEFIPDGDGYNSEFAHVLSAAVEYLTAQQKAVEGGWIKCSERPPEEGEEVLIYYTQVPNKDEVTKPEIDISRYNQIAWKKWGVTHWMPMLPPPPTESE